MEKINKRLTDKQKNFFNDLSIYINKPIYFYGSIYRTDYFPGKSDIDIDIFTDNESSTIQMLSDYLNIKKNNFRKFFYKLESTIVTGYKTKYKNDYIDVEIAIFNNKYKTLKLNDDKRTTNLPIYICIILTIVKFFYYNLGIISNKIYMKIKNILMNPGAKDRYIVIDF
jgi:hypothetical protein